MKIVSYDHAVKFYDSTRGYPISIPEKIRDAIIQYTNADSSTRFIELGIGTGLIALPFLESNYNYIGLDISLPMMLPIFKKIEARKKKYTPLVQANITKTLPFPSKSFDVVSAVRVFHLLDNWKATVDEAKRLLKPGGYLLSAYVAKSGKSNSLDPVKIVHTKWDEILEQLGIPKDSVLPGLALTDETIATYLQDCGAKTEIVDLVKYESDPVSVRMIVERHKQRMFSRDWELSDDIHNQASKLLDAWLNNECTYPDKKVHKELGFRSIIAHWSL